MAMDAKKALGAGIAAGLISGLVKLGWENVLPPRTADRDAENPPYKTMKLLGVPDKLIHQKYHFSGHEIEWPGFIIHFGFSASFAALYELLRHKYPAIAKDHGTLYGIGVWAAFHLGVMPALNVVPSAKDQPKDEHVSELLGHMVWMWTNDLVGKKIYAELTNKKD
ncbi:membrane protein [Ligilactobacillus salitolerans]|uniref:Membrane protein n=1 Tax=Ligilactobacillus salitolerans TaxID=1808352 RepID=A0A401IRS5_9LACO|nr:DUF1440 domain-containing protein [Ligilactobacillus salitolerans]GBG94204.1 membrane protein [Ligilactobacillus salitolerans]